MVEGASARPRRPMTADRLTAAVEGAGRSAGRPSVPVPFPAAGRGAASLRRRLRRGRGRGHALGAHRAACPSHPVCSRVPLSLESPGAEGGQGEESTFFLSHRWLGKDAQPARVLEGGRAGIYPEQEQPA